MRGLAVAGATGYLGKEFVKRTNCDVIPRAFLDSINIGGDRERGPLIEFLSGREKIINFIGYAHRYGQAAEEKLIASNLITPLTLLRMAGYAGVKEFIHISSTKIYGDAGFYTDASIPCLSGLRGAYGTSKLQAEQALMALGNKLGVRVISLRSPPVYGIESPGMVTLMLKWALKNYISRGRYRVGVRSVLYIDDFIDALCKVQQSKHCEIHSYIIPNSPIDLGECITYCNDIGRVNLQSILLGSMSKLVIAYVLGRSPSDLTVNPSVSSGGLITQLSRRLSDDFIARGDQFRDNFNWTPQTNHFENIKCMAKHYGLYEQK